MKTLATAIIFAFPEIRERQKYLFHRPNSLMGSYCTAEREGGNKFDHNCVTVRLCDDATHCNCQTKVKPGVNGFKGPDYVCGKVAPLLKTTNNEKITTTTISNNFMKGRAGHLSCDKQIGG